MSRKGTRSIAEPITRLQCELEEYRRMHPRRAKLPESIRESATELAGEHGVYAVAQALRLDYRRLKRRLGGEAAGRRPGKSRPVFVELIAPSSSAGEECLIAFESTRGGKMSIHWPVRVAPDWTALLRAWRGSER